MDKVFGEELSKTRRSRMFHDANSSITDVMNVLWSIHSRKAGSGDADMLAHLTEAQTLLTKVKEEVKLAEEAANRE
jgi:hypothetical protein